MFIYPPISYDEMPPTLKPTDSKPTCSRRCMRELVRGVAAPDRWFCPDCCSYVGEEAPKQKPIEPYANTYLNGVRMSMFSCRACGTTNEIRMP